MALLATQKHAAFVDDYRIKITAKRASKTQITIKD